MITDILGANVRRLERKAVVYYENKYVPYPFENGIYVLEPELRAKIGRDIIAAMLKMAEKPKWAPITFKDWIYGFFGNAMGSSYLEPYNRKIWKIDPVEMDASWVFSPGRLPFPLLDDIVSSIAGIQSVGYKEQQFFYYPKSGGIKALYDSLLEKVEAAGVNFVSKYRVTKVVKQNEYWLINDDLSARKVINTLPLTILPKILVTSDEVSKIVGNLIYNRDVVVGIALHKPSPKEHVLYVPSKEIVFHRLTWMSNLVGTPDSEQSNLIAETTVPANKIPDIRQITEQTIDGLIKMNIIDARSEVLFSRTWVNEYGYPVYDMKHVESRKEIFDYLNMIGIYSVGRWGSWHYWNTDKVYEAVFELVDKIKE
jgi:protoporphyrinogen oxidase